VLCFHFNNFRLIDAQIQLAETIQQIFNLDSPPSVTIENTGKPTGYETTTQVCSLFKNMSVITSHNTFVFMLS